jgi:catechol 2,3-dioxygenase-like lactoylglutathione lyase family enzyme
MAHHEFRRARLIDKVPGAVELARQGWLMIRLAIPVLHVSSVVAAEDFYCNRLGFCREFAHRGDESNADPCYLGLLRDEARLHLSSFSGDGVPGSVVNFLVDDVDALHREFMAKQVRIDTGPVDQAWGTREMYIRDADGNSIRFQGPIQSSKQARARRQNGCG